MSRTILMIGLLALFSTVLQATTLHIGNGHPYASLEQAAAEAEPGDTLLLHQGTFPGGLYIENLQGTADNWIYIKNAPGEEVIFEGGNNAIQFSDPAYLHIDGLIVQQQTGNGINTDDGGSYDTPAHHVIFENCIFRDMAVDGNNDLLKLSGLDDFEVRSCQFLNGAEGGSGIDMVGCHHGVIVDNYFENMGSNSIQCKGGSEDVRIEGNFFRNGGQRTLNLGGSTGLPYFRPQDATFEAARLKVFSNIIVGSWAAIAYVGSIEIEVVNNTIYQPENWVIRILQETVDPDRFQECGNNIFTNNLVVLSNSLSTETNIGPNTQAGTFTFSNNLWYNIDDTNWDGPNIPVTDPNMIINQDPLLMSPENDDFLMASNSPAAGAGIPLEQPVYDYYGQAFANPPSVGAIEAEPISSAEELPFLHSTDVHIFPNPAGEQLSISFQLAKTSQINLLLFDPSGKLVRPLYTGIEQPGTFQKSFPLPYQSGMYFLNMTIDGEVFFKKIIKK